MSTLYKGLFLLLGAITAAGAFLAFIHFLIDTPDDPLDNQWLLLIRENGAEIAYEDFRFYTNQLPFDKQHAESHVFGQALYHETGVDGIKVCDESFAYGCFHQMFLSSIKEHGISIVHDLDKECIRDNGRYYSQACQHGIGHGLMEYFGEAKINEALEVCDTLYWAYQLSGCRSGVFMEFYQPDLFSAETVRKTRPLDTNNLYEPCPTVPEHSKLNCYKAVAEWWYLVDQDPTVIFERCANITEEDYRNICMFGLGFKEAEFNLFEVPFVQEQCASSNPEYTLWCLAGVHMRARTIPEYNHHVNNICNYFDEVDEAACEAISDKFFEWDANLPNPEG